jgi:hypothetical protein
LSKEALLSSTAPGGLIRELEPPVKAQNHTTNQSRIRVQQSQQDAGSASEHAGDDGDDSSDDGAGSDDGPPSDTFVPDPLVWKELGVSSMTGWRWSHDPALDFPPAIQIRGRNFRSRRQLERWKRQMLRRAIAQRAETLARNR